MKTEMTYKLSTPSSSSVGPAHPDFPLALTFDELMERVEELIHERGIGYLKHCSIIDAKEGEVLGNAYLVTFVRNKIKGDRIEFVID